MRSITTAIAHAIQKMFTYMNGPPSLKNRTMESLTPLPATGAAARTASIRWIDVLMEGRFLSGYAAEPGSGGGVGGGTHSVPGRGRRGAQVALDPGENLRTIVSSARPGCQERDRALRCPTAHQIW